MKTKLTPVTNAHPCAVCQGDHKCSRGDDGVIMCGRCSGEVVGFVCMGKAKGDEQYCMYRKVGDPALDKGDRLRSRGNGTAGGKSSSANGAASVNGRATNGNGNAAPSTDWDSLVVEHARRFTATAKVKLAEALGLPECVLSCLRIGTGKDDGGYYYSFPEVDGEGKTIGISRRYLDGVKKAMAGGRRGLTVPEGLDGFDAGTPLFLPEGPSDVLALRAIDLPAVGRPSNTGGVKHLVEWLSKLPENRRSMLVVLGEYDPKPDGTWPGRDGAVKTAADLAAQLGKGWVVRWALPPKGHKDVREYVRSLQLPADCADAWSVAGEKLLSIQGDQYQLPPDADAEPAYRFEAIDSPTFFTTSYKLEWLVKRVLVAGQPGVVGGPRKALKTTTLIDLAISLASGTPFFDHFEIYKPRRVVLISGESGEAVIQDTGRRICAARRIDPTSLDLYWSFRLPQIANPLDRAQLRAGLKDLGAAVVFIDPAYLCLLAGEDAREIEAGNMFHMGPLLLSLARACLDAGATPILCHHTRKTQAKPGEPLELEDLAFAGIAEFARQWILENRREPFDPETGSSRLWASVGGSAGQSGLWEVDVEEGVLSDEFGGRKWQIVVRTAAEGREGRADAKSEKRTAKQKADDGAVLAAIDRLAEKKKPYSLTTVRADCGLGGTAFQMAVERLIVADLIERCETTVTAGKGAEKPAKSLRRPRREEE